MLERRPQGPAKNRETPDARVAGDPAPWPSKLLEMAQMRWRRINGLELLPLVVHGVKYPDGIQIESKEERGA